MTSITTATEKTSQWAVVNSIRQNLDTKAAICLYTNKNSKRSPMIAVRTSNLDIDNKFMPNFEQYWSKTCNYIENNDQIISSFRSVLP